MSANTGELCIALGIETMVNQRNIDGFNRLMALTEQNDPPEKASRPFDRKRSGFVISEGAAAVMLEPLEHRSQARCEDLCPAVGICMHSQRPSISLPRNLKDGVWHGRWNWLFSGRDCPGQRVGYISAHGTSTDIQ